MTGAVVEEFMISEEKEPLIWGIFEEQVLSQCSQKLDNPSFI